MSKPDWARRLEERLGIAGDKLEMVYLLFIIVGMLVAVAPVFGWQIAVIGFILSGIGAYLMDDPDWVKEERNNVGLLGNGYSGNQGWNKDLYDRGCLYDE